MLLTVEWKAISVGEFCFHEDFESALFPKYKRKGDWMWFSVCLWCDIINLLSSLVWCFRASLIPLGGGGFFFWSSYFSCQIHINKLLSLVRTSTSLPWTTLGFINILNLGYVFFSLHWLSPSVPAQTFIFVPFELQWDDYLLRVGLKLAVCFFSQQV